MHKKTKGEIAGKQNPEEHGHQHIVRYKTKDGNIRTYLYTYGKITRQRVLNKVRNT